MRVIPSPPRVQREEDGWWVVSSAANRTPCYGDGATLPRALWDYLVSRCDLRQLRRKDRTDRRRPS